ncbi:MAG: signal peptidase I [Candidatus Saccharimonadales bacterium]
MDPTKNNSGGPAQPQMNDGTVPPQRPYNGVQVPPRVQNPAPLQRDIDESAFASEEAAPPPAPQAPPAPAPTNLYAPAPSWDKQPQPAPTPPPAVPSPAPVSEPQVPTAPPQPPTPAPIAPPAPGPVTPPADSFSPEPPTPTPPQPAVSATTQVDGFRPAVSPSPTPPSPQPVVAASPPVEATYAPPAQHLSQDVASRISETPQQNSTDIQRQIEEKKRGRHFRGFLSFVVFLAGIFLAAFLINQFIFQSYYVDGTSMTPTLQNEDRLIIDKVEKTLAGMQGKRYVPERGQIVVLDSSIIGINGQSEQLIKRIIGLPGDTVAISEGTVTIRNQENPDGFDVDKLLGLDVDPTYVSEPLEVTVGDNQLFVMGDNRAENGSYDSRAFGPVDTSKIEGRLWARILPLNKARLFD